MSVCVVAEYPWRAIRQFCAAEPPGVIVCNDTRLTRGSTPVRIYHPKQRLMRRNIIVCFTSANVPVTIAALDRIAGRCDAKQIGTALKDAHARHGGLTELIAVVWRSGDYAPKVLEIMPPEYRPRMVSGIVGIGDRDALQWFRDHFDEDPVPGILSTHVTLSPEMLASLEAAVGGPLTDFPPPRFDIDAAALNVAAAFSEGIREAGGPTVALPVQVAVITRGTAYELPIWSSEKNDPTRGADITAQQSALRILRDRPSRSRHYPDWKGAVVKLFP